SLAIAVVAPGNAPVDGVEIFIDSKKTMTCKGDRCRVENLAPGTHVVKVSAPGYNASADALIKILPGDEQVHNATLGPRTEGTGIKVTAEGRGLKLFVDDKEVGPLPQEKSDLTPGDHKIRIEGDRYETYEQTVSVQAGTLTPVEPKLKVKKGLVTIKLGQNAEGASVTLVSGDVRRPIPSDRFKDGAFAVDLGGDKPFTVAAEKKGFVTYEKQVNFDDGQAEQTVIVNLMLTSTEKEPPSGGRHVPTPPPTPRPGPAAAAAPAAPTPAPAAAGNATLTFTSDPPSNLVLDGRPLGKTPKTAQVPAGTHTVLFIHPDFGRKAKSIPVTAGQKATVKVKFP
ncbi:MAG TPA: carboxypeptidase regulatory-like domain-containing protein, partial [Polyangiaceae bacterium]